MVIRTDSSSSQGAPAIHVFVGGIATETNVFSSLPTGLSNFTVARQSDLPDVRAAALEDTTFVRCSARATALGCAVTWGLCAYATPAGITTRAAYESLRDELLADLRGALPVDAVILALHGAMVARGYLDCETDLVGRVRTLVGDGAVVGVLLDPHCDLPDELVELADVILAYREYPHTDVNERADELTRLVVDAACGRSRPTMSSFDCRMVGVYPTSDGPMQRFVQRMREAGRQDNVLDVSLAHGFPWGDSPAAGTRVLVVTDADAPRAESLAEELGRELFSLRQEVNLRPTPLEHALDAALADDTMKPAVVADFADNAGGGAASDSTFVLSALLERGVEDTAVALLWDPIVVEQCFAAGEGAELTVRLGGKMGVTSGDPLDLDVHVRTLVDNLVQNWPQKQGSLEVPCGACARLTCRGIDIVVGSVRQQVLGLEVFTSFGIDPRARRLLVVKSMHHFHAAFAPIAGRILYADSPGALSLDPRRIPYQHTDITKFPWLDNPWALVADD